jgi:hypothetical protein
MDAHNIPTDFTTTARTMNMMEAARHYGTNNKRIRAWAEQCGDGLVEAMLENGKAACRPRGAAAGRRALRRIDMSDMTREAEDSRAMRHLQRATRWVCYSTRIHGDKEIMYHVGNRKLTLVELIELARKYGLQG